MSKRKQYKPRNPVVRAMINNSQKAGLHTDQKKEKNRRACRDNIDNLVDEWYEHGGDISLYEYLDLTKEEYYRYIANNELPIEYKK